jgi:hypothetical protein
MNDPIEDPKPKDVQQPVNEGLAAVTLFRFRWWHKGKTHDGNTISLTGTINACDDRTAALYIDNMLRKKWPTTRWMHGREIEGGNIQYGPTIRRLKGKRNI